MKIINKYWLETDNGEIIELSPRESKVMQIILKDKFISYNNLCNILYLCDLEQDNMNNIILFMSRMNKKISKYIKLKNRRKIGYYVKE